MARQNNKKNKRQQTPSEQEQSPDALQVDGEQDFEDDDDQFDEGPDEDLDGDSVLLLKIQDKINQVDDQEKLSWAAIYQIKKQQSDMNEQMLKEIDAIKEKYEIQRIPLMQKISEAVAGKKLDKSLYVQNEFVKSINLNKTKPKSINDYWSKVFERSGLVGHERDIDLLENLTYFKIELIDANLLNFKLNFEFKENQFLGKNLEIHVQGSVHDGSFKKKLQFEAKCQKLDENSLFGLLTGNDTDDQEFLDTCHDLYRAYVSSTYFYFHEPDNDLDQGQDDAGEEDQNEDSDGEEEDEVRAVQKPKGSSITEKPECKNQ